LIEIKYDPSSQSVNAGTKQCGFHEYELIEMEKAKRDADRYFSEKEYGMAENYYSRIIKIDAKNEHALHRRGHANTYQKKFAEAVSDFTAALAVSADAAHLHGDRGNAYFGAKEYVKSAADFSRAYELAPSNTLHLRNRWAAFCRSGNKASANADHQKLLEIGVPMAMTCEEWLLKQPN
jgi:tetratricopeptide (TPR) repeat protein